MPGAQKSETKEKEPYISGTFVMVDITNNFVADDTPREKEEPCRILSFEKKNKGYEYLVDNSKGRCQKKSSEVQGPANKNQEKQWIEERQKLFSDHMKLAFAAYLHVKLFTKSPTVTVDALLDNMCEGLGKVDENNRSKYRNVLVESVKSSDKLLFNEEAETVSLKPSESSSATTSAHAQSAGMVADKASSATPQGITEKTETARPPANGNSTSESKGTQQEKRHDTGPSQEVDVEKIRFTAYQCGYDAAKKDHEEAIKKNRDDANIERDKYKTLCSMTIDAQKDKKDKAEGLVNTCRTSRGPTTNIHLARKLNDVITPAPTDPKVAQVVFNFLQTTVDDPKLGHPLFYMIGAAKSQEQKRFLISLLNIETLEHYARWLDHQTQDSTQARPLIGGLSELLSRLYDTSSKPHEYRRLCDLMKKLIKRLPEDDQESYYWRLFSFVRESWSRLATKANEGDNDMEAVEEFLTWLPDFAKSMPDALRTTLLVSLMLDVTFVRVYTSIRTSVLNLCLHHVLDAESSERSLRLTALLNLLPASAKKEFQELCSSELLQKGDQ